MDVLRILHLEDDPLDAELIAERLREGGLSVRIERVDTQEDFVAALECDFDVILADYALPRFDGLAALRLAREACPQTPFIFLSGALGEEVAVNSLTSGATDYVLKTRLERLVPAVLRATREAAEREHRRRAEEALRESEARLRLALDAAKLGTWDHDLVSGRFTLSERTARILGMSECTGTFEQIIGCVHAEDAERIREEAASALAGREEGRIDVEFRIVRSDGEVRWVAVKGRTLFAEGERSPRPVRFIGTVLDVTDRKLAEQSLRESEERFRTMADSAPVLIWMTDGEGRCTYVNRRYEEFTGRPAESLRGEGWAATNVHPDDVGACVNTFETALRTRQDFRVQFRLRRADGAYRWVIGTGVPRVAPNGEFPGLIGSLVDVTEIEEARVQVANHRDRLEELVQERTAELQASHERLRLAERMASIGTLATGLGHDMGNLLLPIRCRLDAMEARQLPPGFREDIEAIRQSAEYLQQLTNGLRLLALDPDEATASGGRTDLSAWWRDVVALFKNALPKHVGLNLRIPPGLPHAALAPHRLTQAVLNLVNNAGEALRVRPSGTVTVWAEAADRGSVRIGVTDDGPGMGPEVLDRAMEPFFTTKTRGLSTGLGLSLVHGIARSAGGTFTIRSSPGQGTTAVIQLPIAAAESLTERGDGEGEASVSVRDARMGAVISAVLGSLGIAARRAAPTDPGSALLWITDPDPEALAAAPAFLAADRARRIIVFGPPDPAWEQLGAISLEPASGPSVIRRAIAAAVRSANGEERVPDSAAARR